MSQCILCDLHEDRAPARIIHRDDATFAFFPLRPEVRGHTIVAPRAHVATWPELEPDLVARLFLAAQLVSRRLCSALGAQAVNVLFAGGPEAQQSQDHFHIHVLPRWRGDGVDAWPKLPRPTTDIDADFHALMVAV